MGSKSTTPASVQFLVMCLPLVEGDDSVIFTSIFGPLVGFITFFFIKNCVERFSSGFVFFFFFLEKIRVSEGRRRMRMSMRGRPALAEGRFLLEKIMSSEGRDIYLN